MSTRDLPIALAFDAASIASMHEAFDIACERIDIDDSSSRELAVMKIVELVGSGENDPRKIAEHVIQHLERPLLHRRSA